MEDIKREWYVVNTYAGHENKVKENLQRRIDTMNLQDYLFQIIVAEEKEIEFKNGKKVEKTYNLFPGYLFVEMEMTDEAWYVVRNTPGVTGFYRIIWGWMRSLSRLLRMKWSLFSVV